MCYSKDKYVDFGQGDCLHQLHDINDVQVAPVIIYIVNEKTLEM